MSPAQLRAYLLDPAKDGNPAVEAARELLAERDRLKATVAKLLDDQAEFLAAMGELDAMRRSVEPLHREIDRLRAELTAKTKAPWEAEG